MVCQGLVAAVGMGSRAGWDEVCGAGPCLARTRLDLFLPPNVHLKCFRPEILLVSHTGLKKKEKRARVACMLLIPEASLSQSSLAVPDGEVLQPS